ncbi:MAG: hypothetical protein MUE51_03585 [Thermoleophilia bacterium]|jgi:hypothetical protein|nr:hypothetical protein [Thermoleophilia bacterium]
MDRALRAALPGVLALAALVPAAEAATPLEPGAGVVATRVAVDPQGGAAVLYPLRAGVRVQRDQGGAPEAAPVRRGAIVEGFAAGPEGTLAVLHRTGVRCSGPLLVLRRRDGTWAGEPVPGPAVSGAALTATPEGGLGVVTVDCAGRLAVALRGPTGGWLREETGLRVRPGAPVALAVGAAGAAVAGASGSPAAVAVRAAPGVWQRLPLPGGGLRQGEVVSALAVGLDPAGLPVALVARGPRRAADPAADVLGATERLARRYESGAWLPLAGAGPPVALASAGQAIGLVQASGTVDVIAPAGTARVRVGRGLPSIGPDGTLAWVTRSRRPALAVVRGPVAPAPGP